MSVEFEKYKEIREKPEEAAATIIEFTDEEGYGRFLDLHQIYEAFINIKGIPVSRRCLMRLFFRLTYLNARYIIESRLPDLPPVLR